MVTRAPPQVRTRFSNAAVGRRTVRVERGGSALGREEYLRITTLHAILLRAAHMFYGVSVAAVLVAIGGALGTLLRYGANVALSARFGTGFPYATFVVNALGSCALALLSQVLTGRTLWGVPLGLILGTGVLGGFTTYSSFNLETLRMLQQGQTQLALFYAGLTFATCLALGTLGWAVGVRLMR
jgi:CrcB protein